MSTAMQPGSTGTHRRASTAAIVLVIGIVLSAAAAYRLAGEVEREARLKFDGEVSDAQAAIDSRIKAYGDVLLGVRGLFIAKNSVSRDEFKRYFDSLELSRRYPGIQVIHYSRRFAAAQRSAFEAMVRGDTSVDPRGYPEFAIRPAGDRQEYVVAQYVEPMAGNERALGLDLAGDAVRLAALERTRSSGQLTASGSIALALDPTRHPGFAMRLALYRSGTARATPEQRSDALTGVVSASFVVIDLMRGVLSQPFLQRTRVRIHDAGFIDRPGGLDPPAPENLMFDSDRLLDGETASRAHAGGVPASADRVSELEVGGRRWKLYFSARQEPGSLSAHWPAWAVLAGGITVSLLLFGLIRSLATTGSRALELANRITGDLRRSEASLAEAQRMTRQLIEALPNPIFFKGTDGRYLGVNKAWEAFFGMPRESFLGKTVRELYPEDPGIADRLEAMDQVLWDRPGPQVYETVIRTPDGKHHDAIYCKATFTNAEGRVAGLIGTIIDITERKQAEKALGDSESKYRSVIAAIAEGVLLRDKDRRIVTCNASAERILGRTLAQLKGNIYFDPGWQAIREDGSPFPEHERPVSAALHTGKLQSNVVIGFRKRDGTVLWLSMSAQPLFDEPGTGPAGIVTTIADVTQRKQAELRQAMEHTVTRLLSESEAADEVIQKIIQVIGENLGCPCGAYWAWDERERQDVRIATWSEPRAEMAEFLAPGDLPGKPGSPTAGLVGRARASGEPVWITDVAREAGVRRAPFAAKAGLRGVFAFPVRSGNDILGVMQFFSRDSRPPDEVLMRSTHSIGSQIGQFVARRQAEERVRHLAHYDELTGLPNRSMFNEQLARALAQARRHDKSLAVLFIDLDRFKNINDALGHEAGDRVLREVAERLRGCLREVDTVGRLGGDEFVVLIEDLPQPMHVASVAQKILAALARPFILEAQEFHITASIGISAYPGDSGDVQSLLKNADISMYRAKEQGKNNYQFYSAQIDLHSLERVAPGSSLRRAPGRDEFRPR